MRGLLLLLLFPTIQFNSWTRDRNKFLTLNIYKFVKYTSIPQYNNYVWNMLSSCMYSVSIITSMQYCDVNICEICIRRLGSHIFLSCGSSKYFRLLWKFFGMIPIGYRNTATDLILCIIMNYICFGFHFQVCMKYAAIVKSNHHGILRIYKFQPSPHPI
jgi:hypothetical protein